MIERSLVKWLAAMMLGLVLTGNLAAQAQAPAVATPPDPTMIVDASAFCEGVASTSGTPAPVDSTASLAPNTSISFDRFGAPDQVMSGTWVLEPGSYLQLDGQAALLTVEDGSATVVSCSGTLDFDTTEFDDTQWQLPANTGFLANPQNSPAFYLSLEDISGPVWIVGSATESTQLSLDVLSENSNTPICNNETCWGPPESTPTAATSDLATPEGCPRVRCWSW